MKNPQTFYPETINYYLYGAELPHLSVSWLDAGHMAAAVGLRRDLPLRFVAVEPAMARRWQGKVSEPLVPPPGPMPIDVESLFLSLTALL